MRIMIFTVIFSLLPSIAISQQPTQQVSSSGLGRYQLFAAECTADVNYFASANTKDTERCVFLIDTQSGKVWRYEPGVSTKDGSGNPTFQRPRLIPLTIEAPPIVAP